jgi:hypothetical protein
MDPQQNFGFKEMLTHLIADIARALGQRPGDNEQMRLARTQAVTRMILDLRPRDAIEGMLSGHVVLFHELLTDSTLETLRTEMTVNRRPARGTIVSLDKAFQRNLTLLEKHRQRPSQGSHEAAQTPPVAPPRAEEAVAPAPPSPAVAKAREVTVLSTLRPSADQVAACRANPAAMAALDAGDAEGFARALGIARPNPAYLDAAASGGMFQVNGQQFARAPRRGETRRGRGDDGAAMTAAAEGRPGG